MSHKPRYQLDPWDDPLDLLNSLVSIMRNELGGVRDKLHTLVKHSDPDVRLHAIRRLFVHLKDTSHHEDVVTAFQSDSHAEARRAAAFGIAATSTETSRPADVKVLTQQLLNENEEKWVRGAAYEALLIMHGRTDFPPPSRDIDLIKDVDWNWVRDLQARDSGSS
jgi:HEAT repeat protein